MKYIEELNRINDGVYTSSYVPEDEEENEEYSEIEYVDPDSSPSGSETLPKSIYDLELRRLDPNPEIPEDEKYKEEDLKNAYPDKYERFEKDGEDYSFRYWLYKELDK